MLCALTLWALWRPLHRLSTFKMESVQQRNIAIANERAKEIDSAFDAGDISDDERKQARSDLETALADELATSTELKDQFTRAPAYTSLITLFLVPALALGLYSFTSTYEPGAASRIEANGNNAAPSFEEMVARLEESVNSSPEDQQGLHLLAQTYSRMGRYAEAASRFEQLLKLSGPDADILVSYADNSAMANQRVFTRDTTTALHQALQLDPKHISALWLSGVAAQQLNEPEAALRHWLTLRPMISENSESSQELEILISEVSAQLGVERAAAIGADFTGNPGVLTQAAAPAGITVSVSVSPELQSEVSDGDSVFIFAKAKSGPPMPLAASRHSVSALPITVKLDDSMAMLPQMKLSNFEQVLVGARISKSGQAISQPGDLESDLIITSNTTADTIELVISKRRL